MQTTVETHRHTHRQADDRGSGRAGRQGSGPHLPGHRAGDQDPGFPSRQGPQADHRRAGRARRRARGVRAPERAELLPRGGDRRGPRADRRSRGRRRAARARQVVHLHRHGRGAAAPGARRRSSTRASRRAAARPSRPRRRSTPGSSGCSASSPSSSRSSGPRRRPTCVTVSLTAPRDGEPLDALTREEYLYSVGSGEFGETMDAKLLGTKPGDIVEFDEELPAERFGEELAGAATFRVLVKDDQGAAPARARRRVRLDGLGVRHDRRASRGPAREAPRGEGARRRGHRARPRAAGARRRRSTSTCPSR